MFELPEAKRVRREDLNDSGDSGAESDDGGYDADLQVRLNAQIARSLGITETYARTEAVVAKSSPPAEDQLDVDPKEAETGAGDEKDEDGDEEFAFRLFSNAQPSQKVVLEVDLEPKGDGAITVNRPLSYYVVTGLTEEEKQQYAFAAVTGDDVLARSKDRAWGFEMPWKVVKTSVTRRRKPGESTTCLVEEDMSKKKRRPGKKQRISLRKRAKAKEDRKQAEEQKLLEKEEHIKEKKKRMNRLKKLRKRAKNKQAKQSKDGEGNGESEVESDASE